MALQDRGYAYQFATQQVTTMQQALPCGDFPIARCDRLIAACECKSLPDLVSSLLGGMLPYTIGGLAALTLA